MIHIIRHQLLYIHLCQYIHLIHILLIHKKPLILHHKILWIHLNDPAPFAGVTSYGESAINYTLRVWCKSADYWDVFFAVNQNVKKTFEERGIAMTYPHLNVHLDK